MRGLGGGLCGLCLLLSACVGQGPEVSAAGGPGGFDEAPVPDAATIEGLVVDDSVNPIPGAVAQLAETGQEAVSGADGRFVIRNVAPGAYRVFVAALGYESAARAVTVGASETVPLTFTLSQLASTAAYHEVFGPYAGYFECRLGTPTQTGECGWVSVLEHPTFLYPNDRSIFRFNMTSEAWATFQGEMQWKQGTFATSQAMRFAFSHEKRDGTHRWCSGEGGSPLYWRLDEDGAFDKCDEVGSNGAAPEPAMKHNPLRAYANVPFGSTSQPVYLALQQKFEAMVSAFYGEAAPEGYTAFPDA